MLSMACRVPCMKPVHESLETLPSAWASLAHRFHSNLCWHAQWKHCRRVLPEFSNELPGCRGDVAPVLCPLLLSFSVEIPFRCRNLSISSVQWHQPQLSTETHTVVYSYAYGTAPLSLLGCSQWYHLKVSCLRPLFVPQ